MPEPELSNYSHDGLESPLLPERAVVIGAGIGGLAAAAALRNHFQDVLIIERDELPTQPEVRRGVPQSTQLHNLLYQAQTSLENLIPGFTDDIKELGASQTNVANETHVYEFGINMPERDFGFSIMSAARPKIEFAARNRLEAEGRIEINLGHVVGIQASPEGTVESVLIDANGGKKSINASLVVDASGTGSQAPEWLNAIDEQVPIDEVDNIGQWYVSTMFKRLGEFIERGDFWITLPDLTVSRSGLVSPMDDDLWHVSFSGRANDKPPKDVGEVRQYATSLGDQAIARLIKHAEPMSAPRLFRKTSSRSRRYDLLEKPLVGFIPLGDSLSSLNPLYGQGMSVASMQAVELDALLGLYKDGSVGLPEITRRYVSQAIGISRNAQMLTNALDQTITENTVSLSYGLRQRAFASLIEADPELHELYVRIVHLLEPVSSLSHPSITDRVDKVTEKLRKSE